MKLLNKVLKCCAVLFSVGFLSHAYALDADTPVGYWKTIDDVSGKPKSIIEIYKTSANTLDGRVLKIFPSPGKDENEVCDACKGQKHNQRIVGMVVLEGIKQKGMIWQDGQILDPKSGKTYRCTLKPTANGTKLNVHGYIGLPILGRTQTWLRIDKV